jgi:hypothetical protein
MSNYLTIFSNGMAHFTRSLPPVRENTTVQIPVKRKSLADALATLAVFGNVRITEPPSYPVVDADKVLTVDPSNVTRDLATKLSGTRIKIEERGGPGVTGTLFGIQPYEERVGEAVVEHYRVGVYGDDGGYYTYNDSDVKSIQFLDPTVQQEIKKALERNYATINPASTIVTIGLAPSTESNESIIYQLTIPFSAWQPVYQLRLKNNKCEIEASAKVDNPTDEDLNDYIVSVATGDPNTFETDLADVRKPRRQRVNIISDQATGAVGAEDALPEWSEQIATLQADQEVEEENEVGRGGGVAEAAAARLGAARALRSMPRAAAVRSMAVLSMPEVARAEASGAVVSDVGDFALYTSKNPVNIGRQRSAVIPLFQAQAEGQALLLYKEQADPKRPYRAVKFKNTTEYSLGKGSCTVYMDDVYQGQVILEGTKPGEERILPHARENGVRAFKNPPGSGGGSTSDRRMRIEIVKGTVVIDNVNTHETVYRFVNSKPETFNMEIEHQRQIGDARTTFQVKGNTGATAALENGLRIPCKLPSKGQTEVRVQETYQVSHTVILYQTPVETFQWFLRTVIDVDEPPDKLVKSRKISKVIDLFNNVTQANEKVRDAEQEVKVLSREQARKLELVKSGGSGTQVDTWRQELASNEKEIHSYEREKLPALRKAVKEAENALTEALKNLTVSWLNGENGGDEPGQ